MRKGDRSRSVALLWLALLFATVLPGRQLPVRVFTMGQGLPRNMVSCLVPGANGMLWVCTSEGLARFDGYQFRLFGPEHGLPARRIVDLQPSRKGGFWLVVERGICRLKSGAQIGDPCEVLPVDHLDGFFQTVLESRTGRTWAVSTLGLYELSSDGRRLERRNFQPPRSENIISLADGADGAVLAGTDLGLYEYRDGQPTRTLSESTGNIGINDMLWVRGELILATTRGLYRMPGGTGPLEPIDGPENHALMESLLRRSDGSIWTSSGQGIWRLNVAADGTVSVLERYSERDGLPTKMVGLLAEDRQGNLWGSPEDAGTLEASAQTS